MAAAASPAVALSGTELSAALRAGISRLISREEIINKINVFPVPDGDTGTNLALTLQAVLAALRGNPDAHAGQTLTRIADAALDSARGNSGAILAQFLLGVGDRAGHLAELTADSFADAVGGGANYARESLAEPREGTILTVLSDFARAAAREVGERGVREFPALFRASLAAARRSLEATRDQLEALRRANVVDAGALGFVELIAGMSDYLETGVAPDEDSPIELVQDEQSAAGQEEELEYRYCAECMVTGPAIDRRKLREQAAELGGSLIVAGTQRKVRLHLHLNEPRRLFELAVRHGEVSGEKADDMQRQQEMVHHARRRRVAVVIDSAADLPDSVLEQLDIHMVPARVHFGAHSYLDKISLSPEQFFRELATNPQHPKTSLPPPGDFRRAFEFLGSHYEGVVYVGLTARLSGTYQSAETGAGRARTRARILMIDSQTASLGQGLIAMRAAEVAAAGADAAAVREAALVARGRTRTWGCLVTLDYAVRGGRVPRWVRTVANLLRLTPILAVGAGGGIGPGGILFGRAQPYRRFGRFLRRRLDTGCHWRIGIAHADAAAGAELVRGGLAAALPQAEILPVMPLGSALGVHAGPGCVVVAAQEMEAPDAAPDAEL